MWDGRENIETDTPWESTSNDTVWENADDTEDVEWEPQDVEEDAWTADYKDKAPSIKQESHNSLHRPPKTSANRETAAYTRISGETDSPNHSNAIRPIMIAIITLIVLAIGIFFICKMLVGKDAFSTVKSDKPNAAFVSDHTQNPWENNNIGSTEITETQTNEVIANGYIDAGDQDYVLLYQTPEESAEAVARAYTGDAVEIFALQGQWYQVKLGEVVGYLSADYITFSEPVVAAAETQPETTVQTEIAQTKAAAQTTDIPLPTISASIKVTSYTTIGDGDSFVLNVSGDYAVRRQTSLFLRNR